MSHNQSKSKKKIWINAVSEVTVSNRIAMLDEWLCSSLSYQDLPGSISGGYNSCSQSTWTCWAQPALCSQTNIRLRQSAIGASCKGILWLQTCFRQEYTTVQRSKWIFFPKTEHFTFVNMLLSFFVYDYHTEYRRDWIWRFQIFTNRNDVPFCYGPFRTLQE